MKRSFLVLLLFLGMVISCNSGDDAPTNTNTTNTDTTGDTDNDDTGDDTGNDTGNDDPVFVDPDGDGIDSQVEIDQGTDPEDGCSFLVESIDFSLTAEEWRETDCDGDGVTNGNELDPDGNIEIDINTTDPLDPCSLNIGLQENPPISWMELNCDDDCFPNGMELAMGTNPLIPDNLQEPTGILDRIEIPGYQSTYTREFSNNPQRLNSSYSTAFGALGRSFDYDANGNLTLVTLWEADQGTLGEIPLEYEGDQLISIGNAQIEHNGNFIRALDQYSPPGLFSSELEIDPVSGRVISCEKYIKSSTISYDHEVYTFHYDAFMENLEQVELAKYYYNSNTGADTYIETTYFNFTYFESVLNPASEAYSYLLIPYLLYNDPYDWNYISDSYFEYEGRWAMISKNFIKSIIYPNYTIVGQVDNCAEYSGYPLRMYSYNGGLRKFFYE